MKKRGDAANKAFRAAGCAVLILSAGCTMSMPERQDPFAGVGLEAAGGYPGLSIALISSKNTKASADYGRWGEKLGLVNGATDKWLRQEVALFKRNFGKVSRADSFAAAKSAGVDLIGVVDVYDQTFRSCKYDETVIFVDPDGKEVDRVRGTTDIPFRGAFSTGKVLDECVADVQGQIESGIRGSKALRDLAERRAAAPAAKGAAPPASPSPGFSAQERPDDLAVIVGVETYSNIGSNAAFAERDADAFKAYARALGVPERNIVLLNGSKAGAPRS